MNLEVAHSHCLRPVLFVVQIGFFLYRCPGFMFVQLDAADDYGSATPVMHMDRSVAKMRKGMK